jgi:hypothetical protein
MLTMLMMGADDDADEVICLCFHFTEWDFLLK